VKTNRVLLSFGKVTKGKIKMVIKSKMDNCLTCGKMVSMNANSCPHCGEPNPTKEKNKRDSLKEIKVKLIMMSLIVLFGIFLLKVWLPHFQNDVIKNMETMKIKTNETPK